MIPSFLQRAREFTRRHCLCLSAVEHEATTDSINLMRSPFQSPCICSVRSECQNVLDKLLNEYRIAESFVDYQDQEQTFRNIERKLCIMIGLRDLTPVQVIKDIVEYANRNRHSHDRTVSWQALHFARYVSYKFNIRDSSLVQRLFTELFWITGCVEEQAFVPEELVVNSFWFRFIDGMKIFREMHLATVEYFLSMVANLKIDLNEFKDIVKWTVYGGLQMYPYIDLHVWFRGISLWEINDQDIRETRLRSRLGWSSMLFLAYSYQMEDLGLLLLRYNASPTGPVLQLVFKQLARQLMLENHPLYRNSQHNMAEYIPKKALRHCLRTVTTLSIEIGDYDAVERQLSKGFYAKGYVVSRDTIHLLPLSAHSQPATLRQCCRVILRKTLFDSGHLPPDIFKLDIPRHLQNYLDLLTD